MMNSRRRRRPNRRQDSGNLNSGASRGRVGRVGRTTPHPGRGFRAAPPRARIGAPAPSPAPAPAAPAPAPAAPVGQHFVPDAQYNAETALSQRESEYASSQLNDRERQIKHEYGIDDPTNPFSRITELKRLFLQRGRGASAGLASRGHLYSGQHERAMSSNRRAEEKGTAELKRDYESQLAGIRGERQRLVFAQERDRQGAMEGWLSRQADIEPEVDEAPEPAGPARAAGLAGARAASRRSNRAASSAASRAAARARARAKLKAHPAPNRRQGSGNTRKKRR